MSMSAEHRNIAAADALMGIFGLKRVPAPDFGKYGSMEAACLARGLFDGDFGEPGDLVMSDKFVVAAKPHCGCHNCGGGIAKGERHRAHTGKYGGQVHTYRLCSACCHAFALSWTDNGNAMCARFAMRSAQA